jgi:hypothetical protein
MTLRIETAFVTAVLILSDRQKTVTASFGMLLSKIIIGKTLFEAMSFLLPLTQNFGGNEPQSFLSGCFVIIPRLHYTSPFGV